MLLFREGLEVWTTRGRRLQNTFFAFRRGFISAISTNESAPLCGDLLTRIAATISLDVNVLLHAEAGPVDDDVDEVEGQPGEEGDQDDADEEEESLLAPPVTLGVRSPPQRELGQLQIYPGVDHQL